MSTSWPITDSNHVKWRQLEDSGSAWCYGFIDGVGVN